MVNREEIIDLYNQGYTLQEIGARYGVSRQRAWQLLKPNYDRLIVKRKPRNNTVNPNKGEKYVFQKLTELGFKNIEHCGYNYPCDLIADGKTIEVKTMVYNKNKSGYYHFHNLKDKETPDFYVFLIADASNPTAYIIPGDKVTNSMSFTANPIYNKKRDRLYRNNWMRLKK